MKGGRAGHKVEAVGGKLYVMGGWRKFKFLDEVEEYNPLKDEWTIKTKMPEPLAYFGSVSKNGQIYTCTLLNIPRDLKSRVPTHL